MSQERETREHREELAALYVGVRDGYVAANIAIGKAKPTGSYDLPWYLRTESIGLTGAALENAVDAFILKMGLGRG